MRIRVPELMEEREMSAYALAKAVAKCGVSEQAVYRLVRAKGQLKRVDMRLLGALCHVFQVGPGDLLERDRKKGR